MLPLERPSPRDSPGIDLDKPDRLVREINAARPAAVFLLGDFVIRGVADGRFVTPETIARHLSRIEAPLGVYASRDDAADDVVYGGHDMSAFRLADWGVRVRYGPRCKRGPSVVYAVSTLLSPPS